MALSHAQDDKQLLKILKTTRRNAEAAKPKRGVRKADGESKRGRRRRAPKARADPPDELLEIL